MVSNIDMGISAGVRKQDRVLTEIILCARASRQLHFFLPPEVQIKDSSPQNIHVDVIR